MKNAIKALFVMSLMASSLAYGQSTTNSIYIDQVGGNSTIDIRQKGQNNRIGSEQARVSIQGNAMNVTVDQNGNNNNITGKIEQADNVVEDVTLTGDGNTINYDVGDSGSVAGSTKTLAVTGDSNTLNFNQGTSASATGATQNITVTGDTNTITHASTATGTTTMNATITGNLNNLSVTQSGITTQSVNLNASGNSNTITVTQSN